MTVPRIVIDTNVLLAALRSRSGASYRLVSLIGTQSFELAVSVALILEYEAVAKRPENLGSRSAADIDAILDYLCRESVWTKIHYTWRPVLRDSCDELVLELAAAAQCEYIVTFNLKDFKGAERFGIAPLTPRAFLNVIGVSP